ncbi:forkhead protein sep1 [Diplogelasinospora grovesii]|uniref:Forkhead protein sep1 n=1 Tax=Diplogelasinospora grovesii TaxID=303347 RepID=A0AAN6NB05_9PEZI|nr:forkhead protein sep1 [Diplogelasinospora grovesii]
MAKHARLGSSEQPLQIFQDDFYIHSTPVISHAPMPTSKQQRRPLQSSNGNLQLNPPNMTSARQSPFKAGSRHSGSPLTPLKPSQGNKLNMVPMMPPGALPKSTDSLQKKEPMMSRFKTVAQKPVPDMNMQHYMPKETQHPIIYPAPPHYNINMNLENYYQQKPSGKRVLLEAAPIKELRPAKKPRLDEPLPPHDSFPPIIDDGAKPGHSYATLIGMAILRSPQRRLTLAQIYKWISDTYSFYKADDAGWQNSIRHNLSLNKNFIKQERPKDDPGKGNYWAIEPGAEHLFLRDKPSRKAAASAENIPVMSTRLEPSQPQIPLLQEPMLPPQLPMNQNSLPALPMPSSQPMNPSAMPAELSSDATIPASDMPTFEETHENLKDNGVLNETDLYSPLPAAMHSSPPIPKHIEQRHHNGTPPSLRRRHGSSVTKPRSHKRNFASMDDSGYISSLESSAMRPGHAKLLTSEADRPRIKRGRAEEEIARLRASSYDSPSKGRSYTLPPASSSPLRQHKHNETGQMLPPLTPAMKLKAPPKPPPSVSPSTNLRLHRESVQSMVDSPFRRVAALLPDDNALAQLTTPGFKFDEVLFGLERKADDDTLDFDIFQDSEFATMFALSPAPAVHNGSPVKRSVKRARMDRAHSTSALGDVTNFGSHSAVSLNSGNFLKIPGQNSSLTLDTPSKVFDGLPSSPSKLFLQSPSKMPLGSMNDENMAPWMSMDDLCTADFLENDDFQGIDMLAGFEKIGSSQPVAKKSQKPGFGRSYTSAF